MLEKQKDHLKIRIILKIAITIAFVVFVISLFVHPHATFKDTEGVTQAQKPVTLVFVGDIMMDRGVRRSIEKNFDGDYNALFQHTGYLKDADIAFGNLEGPAAQGGHNVGSRFSFRMDPQSLAALAGAGFDVVSFANNHVGDWAQAAFDETLQNLAANNILYTGAGANYAEATTPRILTVRGMKIGFLAATDVGPTWMQAGDTRAGVLLATDKNLSKIIADAKAQVDILVVSFHFGVEYSPANARQEKLAHAAIDSGADIVVGSHPHVMQRVESYQGKPIFYSLGNFIFDQYFSPYTLQGMVAQVSIDPQTKQIQATEKISPLSKQFVPQTLIPFDTSALLSKSFVPQ